MSRPNGWAVEGDQDAFDNWLEEHDKAMNEEVARLREAARVGVELDRHICPAHISEGLPLVREVKALRAEVERLRMALHIGIELDNHHNAAMCPYCHPAAGLAPVPYDEHEREVLEVIAERDRLHDVADALAAAIAPSEVLGEHSSDNDPWQNALDFAAPAAGLRVTRDEINDAICKVYWRGSTAPKEEIEAEAQFLTALGVTVEDGEATSACPICHRTRCKCACEDF